MKWSMLRRTALLSLLALSLLALSLPALAQPAAPSFAFPREAASDDVIDNACSMI